ncbi:STAS domain-containing protein [Streptomyces sp. NPDC050528]|uniref:STAS domain-containing protein n=1 Tax=unclassified Streptomyces TaxID=2593676 RepID=UPI0037BB7111
MSTTPQAGLRLTTIDTERTVRIELAGDLDYDNADSLLAAVTTTLAEHRHLSDLHLHCAELDIVDSMGLSILLMIRRRTGEAGVHLHLDDRTPQLDRLLTITGILDHLTASPADVVNAPRAREASTPASWEETSARPTGPHGTA